LTATFVRHRGLIAFCAGGAMAEAALLSALAPAAAPLAPQVTALPPLAAYHDLRWLFAFGHAWPGFTSVLVLLLLARSAADAIMLLLAWPCSPGGSAPGSPRPRFLPSMVSCAVLTVLVWLVMSPVVTLMFGAAVLPFSWPFLAAVPILLGTALVLSQGGVGQAWWRRLPPARTAAWLLATFAMLSAASAVMPRLDTAGVVAVAGLVGLVDARAWYGLTAAAVRRIAEQPPRAWHWPREVALPVAPLAAVLVIALVVGLARLAFTGTVRLSPGQGPAAAGVSGAHGSGVPGVTGKASDPGTAIRGGGGAHGAGRQRRGALLVVAGFGSTCCNDADALRAEEPGMLVRQFSYLGLNAAGSPIPYGPAAGDLPIQVLGDRMAAQVDWLYRRVRAPVDVVAESEGTLGLYAMLARHPRVPVGSVVLLSPIVEPGRLPGAGLVAGSVPGDALITLNDLIGDMSRFGSAGARALIDSVSRVGAGYFARASRRALPWLAVVPLADAVTLPAGCPWPRNVTFVAAFHGGLLGDPSVRQMIVAFLSGGTVPGTAGPDAAPRQGLRGAAQLIAAAAAAWRMPDLGEACPS